MSNKPDRLVSHGLTAKEALVEGVTTLLNAVASTMGPGGRNVLIQKPGSRTSAPVVTKDGVTVANSIQVSDNTQNMGIQLLKAVASNTARDAGDGTTTATVLGGNLFIEGMRVLKKDTSLNVIQLKRGMDIAAERVISILKENSRPISDINDISNIATISSNHDPVISGLITSAIERVGRDGLITIEESKTMNDSLDIVKGMRFDRGYYSQHLVTDNRNMTIEYTNPRVLVTDQDITMAHVLPILEEVAANNTPLVIFAPEFDDNFVGAIIHNFKLGKLKVALVKAPGYGDRMRDYLEDIAILTSGIFASNATGESNINIRQLGSCGSIKITKNTVTLIDGAGTKEAIDFRVEQLRTLLTEASSDYEVDKLRERISKLSGGMAVIRVGGATETEVRERMDRVDDALSATRSAIEEGVVTGGGHALFRASLTMGDLEDVSSKHILAGYNLLRNTIRMPLKQLVSNAGICHESVVADVTTAFNDGAVNNGYDVSNEKITNLFDAGIIDPLKVERIALLNAVSAAGMLLTTETVVVDKPIDKSNDLIIPSDNFVM